MKIEFVQVQNFKSFIGGDIDFSNLKPGLYFVSGENKIEPELGANGAGKSSLFEAICWCLYGKTSTNLKAGNVVKWGEKGGAVEVRFDAFTATRGQSPNYLHINHEPATQEELEAKLGHIGFESFLYSTFISQFSSKFFDLTPADKMVVFSDIMAELLQPWLIRSDQARVKAEEKKKQIATSDQEKFKLLGNLEMWEKTSYSEKIKQFEKEKKAQIDILKDQLITARKELQTFEKDQSVIEERIVDYTKKKSKLKPVDKEKIEGLYEEIRRVKGYLVTLEVERKSYSKQLNDLERSGKYSICPTCRQKVDKQVLKWESVKIKKEIDQLSAKITRQESEHEKMSEEFNKLNDREKKNDQLRMGIEIELRHWQSKKDSGIFLKKKILNDIDRISDDINSVKSRENDYIKLEAERKERLKEISDELEIVRDHLASLQKDHDAYSYWAKGFREIRLLLMYDSLKEFEVSINNNLSKFGMEGWNVKLDIDQENKSGTVRKGFSVLVESPDHSGHVPFEVWSGGEGQRLRLAGTIGLMDLIQSKRGMDFGLEIFDEPTAWLSEQGIDDLIQILYYRAKEIDRKIFLIDHKDLKNFGGFSGIINVVKDKDGSHVEVN